LDGGGLLTDEVTEDGVTTVPFTAEGIGNGVVVSLSIVPLDPPESFTGVDMGGES
jgi:hypothetical protein